MTYSLCRKVSRVYQTPPRTKKQMQWDFRTWTWHKINLFLYSRNTYIEIKIKYSTIYNCLRKMKYDKMCAEIYKTEERNNKWRDVIFETSHYWDIGSTQNDI
jgi:hypothetical protein